MSIFTHRAALEYWRNYKDDDVYRIVTFMESQEAWTVDDISQADSTEAGENAADQEAALKTHAADSAALESAIDKLGEALRSADRVEFGEEKAFITIISHLKMSRFLRILQAVDKAHPGAASKLLSHAEEMMDSPQDIYGLFLMRNLAFERLRLLYRMLSEKRLQLVQKALEEEGEDT